MASPSIVNYGAAVASAGNPLPASVGGTLANDILFLWAGTDSGATITGVATTGLVWTKILDLTNAGSGNNNAACSLWWAKQTGSGSVVATATFSGSYDDAAGVLFNVRGCSVSAPFDPNPNALLGWTGNPPGTMDYSTTNADDLIIVFRGGELVNPFGGFPAGYTKTGFSANSGGAGFMSAVLGFKSVAAPQTTIPYNDDANISSFACVAVCAMTADASLNPPGVPTGEACGPNTMSSITAEWTTGSGGTPVSYTLQWRPVGGGAFTQITGITGTSQVISGLASGASFEWQVQAINADGASAFSGSTICSTLAVGPPTPPPAGGSQSLSRWRGQVGINWLGLALVGDAFTNVIGLSDFANYTEYGNTMRFLVTSPPVHSNRHRMFIPRFEVDVEAGSGFANTNVGAPVMMLDYSKDGGKTFVGLQKWRSTGKVGQYTTRLRWLNLGNSRAWVFRLQCTDNTRRQIIGVYMDSYEGLG